MFRTVGRVPITDDRGSSVDLVQPPNPWPPELQRWSWGRQRVITDPAMRVEYDCGRRTAITYGLVGGLLMSVASIGVRSGLAAAGMSAKWLWIIAPALAGSSMWPLYRPVGRSVRKSSLSELRNGYLNSGRCASCGFVLDGLPVEGDGMTVCPECGAAWRVKDWSRNPVAVAASNSYTAQAGEPT